MAKVGYVRVSTLEQNTERQLDGMQLDRVFEDKMSGKDKDRPALDECVKYLRAGDELYVHSLDRLARNLRDLQDLVESMTTAGVTVKFVKEGLTFSSGGDSAFSKLMLQMLGAIAEFERNCMLERQREGIAKAKKAGKYQGGKRRIHPEVREAIKAAKG